MAFSFIDFDLKISYETTFVSDRAAITPPSPLPQIPPGRRSTQAAQYASLLRPTALELEAKRSNRWSVNAALHRLNAD
jgi:hypothetical protein